MIRIGEFAKICGASIQTLRYYDSCGILPADQVDPDSGYRMYAPEAVEKYRMIRFYQEMGFSLAEIKKLLSSSDDEKRSMLLKKKKELTGSLDARKGHIAQIDEICQNKAPTYPIFQKMMSIPFENDDAVLGKWKLCGKSMDGKEILPPDDETRASSDDELVFLPGGACYWKYFWTKGVVYRIHPTYLIAIPNKYRIETSGTKRLMFVDYVSNDCIDNAAASVCLVYEETLHAELTEFSARKHIDNVDLPYVPDPDVTGVWATCDYIERIEDFDPDKPKAQRQDFWILELRFCERGMLCRILLHETKRQEQWLKYTKGKVLNEQLATAEEFVIKKIRKEDYLFVQHKSGDYYYGGKAPHFYVFKRKPQTEENHG